MPTCHCEMRFSLLLFLPQERWQSIIMSMSVCLSVSLSVSVCLSASISPEPHARSLPNFCACCLLPWLCPPAGWRTWKGQFWDPYENGWTDPDAVCWLEWALGICVTWGTWSPWGRGNFWGKCSGPLCSNRTLQCAVQNCWTDRHAVLDEDLGGPMEQCIRWACRFPSRRDNFRGFSGPFKSIDNLRCNVTVAFAAKGIMQSPITSCSRKDHLVC